TAYTSYSLSSAVRVDWFADFPEVWTARFPVLFHLLQKPFFLLFGPSLEALRVSVWPYYVAITAYTFALGSLLFSRRTGFAAAALWTFFGATLYLHSMGLHFITSTCFYLA